MILTYLFLLLKQGKLHIELFDYRIKYIVFGSRQELGNDFANNDKGD